MKFLTVELQLPMPGHFDTIICLQNSDEKERKKNKINTKNQSKNVKVIALPARVLNHRNERQCKMSKH
jgi:hypothetical protein